MQNEIRVNSCEEFETEIAKLRREYSSSNSPLLFRGHESAAWNLDTTLERTRPYSSSVFEYYRTVMRISPQIETFVGVRFDCEPITELDNLLKEYDKFSIKLSNGALPGFNYLAYLRHHGFPSPLLDWTRSQHVAAYHAFSKARDETKDVAVWVLIEKRGCWKVRSSSAPQIHSFGRYARTHKRHFLQQSEYTVCLYFDGDKWCFRPHEEILCENDGDQDLFWKIVVPSKDRTNILKKLDEYNLNAFSLFGSEESLMETLALREIELKPPIATTANIPASLSGEVQSIGRSD